MYFSQKEREKMAKKKGPPLDFTAAGTAIGTAHSISVRPLALCPALPSLSLSLRLFLSLMRCLSVRVLRQGLERAR